MGGQNKLLPMLALAALFALLMVIVMAWSSSDKPQTHAEEQPPHALPGEQTPAMDQALGAGNLTPADLRKLGADADTPADTLATLVVEMKTMRAEQQRLMQDNQALLNRNQQLEKLEVQMENKLQERLAQERNKILQDVQHGQAKESKSLLSQLEERLKGASNPVVDALTGGTDEIYSGLGIAPGARPATGGKLPVGGLRGGAQPAASEAELMDDAVVWVDPMDGIEVKEGNSNRTVIRYPDPSVPTSFGLRVAAPDADAPATKGAKTDNAPAKPKDIPAFTLPRNGTFMGSVSMTALIGRIPIKGSVTDPYPFKVLIGRENLSSNGIYVPNEVAGVVISGIATGDWTLSCVSGAVTSLTFTFEDGTLRTYPNTKGSTGQKLAIGWISDAAGVPCVSGERISNAASYLAQRVGLTAASAYYKAAAAAEVTTQTNGYGGYDQAVTGNVGKHSRNEALSAGIGETTDWLEKRQEQQFDAIYVPPGIEVAFHLDEQVEVDFEIEGRRVDHNARLPYMKKQGRAYLD